MDHDGERVCAGEHHAQRHAHRAGDPDALAFDSSGNLYVANYGSDTVSEFAPGSTRHHHAHRTESSRRLAFDSGGNLYVANGRGWHHGDRVRPCNTMAGTIFRWTDGPMRWSSIPTATFTWPTAVAHGERVRTGDGGAATPHSPG